MKNRVKKKKTVIMMKNGIEAVREVDDEDDNKASVKVRKLKSNRLS